MNALLQSFAAGFEALPPALREAGGLGQARRAALTGTLANGLPGPRSERWKCTPLRAFERRAFVPATTAEVQNGTRLAAIPAPRMVFVNGRFDAALSELADVPSGISLRPLSSALADGEPRAVGHLARRFEGADEAFARANAALAVEGVLLRVDPGVHIAEALHLVFVGAGGDPEQAWHLRHLIELREDARLSVIEHHLASGAHRHLANTVSQVHLKPGACLRHVRIQDEAAGASLIARSDVALAGAAEYRRLDLELGAALSRHELSIALQGERARVIANGVLLARGARHFDTRLGVDHVAGRTGCELLWRGLADAGGRAAFHGGIVIREGADGSVAGLSSKNLLLSENAQIDTQPVLEIHADEVQAAHGATVGRLDDAALFYLRSRGLPEAGARTLLTAAFCREALAVIAGSGLAESLAAQLDAALERGTGQP